MWCSGGVAIHPQGTFFLLDVEQSPDVYETMTCRERSVTYGLTKIPDIKAWKHAVSESRMSSIKYQRLFFSLGGYHLIQALTGETHEISLIFAVKV